MKTSRNRVKNAETVTDFLSFSKNTTPPPAFPGAAVRVTEGLWSAKEFDDNVSAVGNLKRTGEVVFGEKAAFRSSRRKRKRFRLRSVLGRPTSSEKFMVMTNTIARIVRWEGRNLFEVLFRKEYSRVAKKRRDGILCARIFEKNDATRRRPNIRSRTQRFVESKERSSVANTEDDGNPVSVGDRVTRNGVTHHDSAFFVGTSTGNAERIFVGPNVIRVKGMTTVCSGQLPSSHYRTTPSKTGKTKTIRHRNLQEQVEERRNSSIFSKNMPQWRVVLQSLLCFPSFSTKIIT